VNRCFFQQTQTGLESGGLDVKKKMNSKIVLFYTGLFFAGLMILLSSNIQVADAAELTDY